MVAGLAGCGGGGGDDPDFEVTGAATINWSGRYYYNYKIYEVELTAHNNTGNTLEIYWWSDTYKGLDNTYSDFDEGPVSPTKFVQPNGSFSYYYWYYAKAGAFGEAQATSKFLARKVLTGEIVTAQHITKLVDPAR